MPAAPPTPPLLVRPTDLRQAVAHLHEITERLTTAAGALRTSTARRLPGLGAVALAFGQQQRDLADAVDVLAGNHRRLFLALRAAADAYEHLDGRR